MSAGIRLLAVLLAIGLGVALVLTAIPVFDHRSSTDNQEWFGHLAAISALLIFTGALDFVTRRAEGAGSRGALGIVIGADKRLSTSKLQALLWTYAIAFAVLSLIAAKWARLPAGFDALGQDVPDDYLVLLGGPFAAAVAAKAIVGSKVVNGTIVKTQGPDDPSAKDLLTQAFSDDAKRPALVDTQYLLFNFVALVYFFGAFFQAPEAGLPNMPGILLGMTGIGAGTYVANKAVLVDTPGTPVISTLYPAAAKVGESVQVFGKNLVTPIEGTADFKPVKMTFDGAALEATAKSHSEQGDDRVRFTVPQHDPGKVKVAVVKESGSTSNEVDFNVLAA